MFNFSLNIFVGWSTVYMDKSFIQIILSYWVFQHDLSNPISLMEERILKQATANFLECLENPSLFWNIISIFLTAYDSSVIKKMILILLSKSECIENALNEAIHGRRALCDLFVILFLSVI